MPCDSDNYNLRIMIINPEKKKEYKMVKRSGVLVREMTKDTNKTLILPAFPDDLPKPRLEHLEFGYAEPGHGVKKNGF